MSTQSKVVLSLVIAGALGFALYQGLRAAKTKEQALSQQQQQEQTSVQLSNRVAELEQELASAASAKQAGAATTTAAQRAPNETLRLRGEVGRLRQENASIASSNAISKVTANPEARKMLRDTQKMAMSMVYGGLAQRSNLSAEQKEKLNDALADYIMDNVDKVTMVLRDKPGEAEMNRIFAAEDARLHENVRQLMGDEGLQQFQQYSTELLGNITAEQFKGMMSGEGTEKQNKAKQLSQLIQEESKAALEAAGLPADYQTIPMLNLRNIASEQEGERSLKLLDDIYKRVSARSAGFLTAEDLKKFDEFREAGVKNNRAALMLNRTMMAPISQ